VGGIARVTPVGNREKHLNLRIELKSEVSGEAFKSSLKEDVATKKLGKYKSRDGEMTENQRGVV